MRLTMRQAVGAAALLFLALLAPMAQAQYVRRPVMYPAPVYPRVVQPVFVAVPGTVNIRLQTTALIPDGGYAVLGGYSALSEGRSEFGTPGLGQLPYASRLNRNVGYGRDISTGRVIGGVRIIDLREEEYRQTGVRSE